MKIGKNVLFKLMEIERVLNYKKNKFNNTYRHNYTWSKDIYIYILTRASPTTTKCRDN